MMIHTSARTSASGTAQPVERKHSEAVDITRCIQLLTRHYDDYRAEFAQLTRRAADRFSQHDWAGSQADELERPGLFELHALRATASMARCGLTLSHQGWAQLRSQYDRIMGARCEHALAMLFFARIHGLQDSGPHLNLAGECPIDVNLANAPEPDLRRQECTQGTAEALAPLLAAVPTDAQWRDLRASATQAGNRIDEHLQTQGIAAQSIELLMPVLYRFTRAYMIGAVNHQLGKLPFALSVHIAGPEDGMTIDELMTGAAALRHLFERESATFHIDVAEIPAVAIYLRRFIPGRTADILSALGWPTRAADATPG